jgi:predicted RNA-binding Zn-ribbon protein involved in translation (DUF1610 family)
MERLSSQTEEASGLRCPSCGWTGRKGDLVLKEVDLDANDYLRNALPTLLASPPQHKCEYRCPSCGHLLGTGIRSLQPYWDTTDLP